MSSPLVTISEEESVKDAVLLMRSKHIRRLAVKNAGGKVTGIYIIQFRKRIIQLTITSLILRCYVRRSCLKRALKISRLRELL